MKQRQLGTEGPEVSLLGLGRNNFGWRIPPDASRGVGDPALDEGVNLFDTADVYGETASEAFLGDALEGRRDDVFVLTKFGLPIPDAPDLPGGSAAYVN